MTSEAHSRCGVDLWLRTVRTKRHKLTLETNSGAGELYDLANDPQEMDNRFGDAAPPHQPGSARLPGTTYQDLWIR